MRILFRVSAAVAACSALTACNSAASLYASGPWWPGVVAASPGYAPPIVSPKPFDLDVAEQDGAVLYPHGDPAPLLHSGVKVPIDPLPSYREGRVARPPALSAASSPPSAPSDAPQFGSSPTRAANVAPSTRPSSYAGTWKAVDARGSACRVQLSSVPTLDLYKASSSGCADAKLGGLNAWSLRDGNIVLYSRGTVVARLTGFEASLSGKLSNGEGLKLTR